MNDDKRVESDRDRDRNNDGTESLRTYPTGRFLRILLETFDRSSVRRSEI
jgi:hypothetical protein